ncbi:hypothetical protein GQ42DRAFT_176943 [Ramicandelaber brevisporus]|nr:hypothetical protein GQ42DRAFT_176943 [Ramicandelaber brevisporus]
MTISTASALAPAVPARGHTQLRIRRPIEAAPTDTLVVRVPKRQRSDSDAESAQAEPEAKRPIPKLFKLATTVADKTDKAREGTPIVNYIEVYDAAALSTQKKPRANQSLISQLRNTRISNQPSAAISPSGVYVYDVYIAEDDKDDIEAASASELSTKPRQQPRSAIVDDTLSPPSIEESTAAKDQSAATDVDSRDPNWESLRGNGTIASLYWSLNFDNLDAILTDFDDNLGYDSDHDSEDSNAESYYGNDYPDSDADFDELNHYPTDSDNENGFDPYDDDGGYTRRQQNRFRRRYDDSDDNDGYGYGEDDDDEY